MPWLGRLWDSATISAKFGGKGLGGGTSSLDDRKIPAVPLLNQQSISGKNQILELTVFCRI